MSSIQDPLSRLENQLAAVAAFLLFAGLFLLLGHQPLWMEEPRRAMVALEMLYQKNGSVPTLFGEYYYNKPPGWNWMIMLAFSLMGTVDEWGVRLFSVLSFVGMIGLTYGLGATYVSRRFGLTSALLLGVSVDILLYFSQLGEIDLFYSLLTYAGIVCIFHFDQTRKGWPLFLSTYALHGLGLLTKGLPSLVFLGLSLLVYFAYQKQWKPLFSWAHLGGIALFGAMVGGYMLAYDQQHDLQLLLQRLWAESSNRTAAAKGLGETLGHLVSFPLETAKNLLPASLLLPFCFTRYYRQQLRKHPYLFFCLVMLGTHILLYWLSAGTRQRYIYMLYPFAINLLAFGLLDSPKANTYRYGVQYLFAGLTGLIFLAVLALPFVPLPEGVPNRYLFCGVAMLPLAGIAYLGFRHLHLSLWSLVAALAWVRIGFDLMVFASRAEAHHSHQQEKAHALQIARLAAGEDLYLFGQEQFSMRMAFYIEQGSSQVLRRTYEADAPGLYIIQPADSVHFPGARSLYRFEDKQGISIRLVQPALPR